jgi:hypothetical protein
MTMTITIILAFVVFLTLISFIWKANGQTYPSAILENPNQYLRPVDVDAFRNLIDPAEEDYLRRLLVPTDFRKIQRERLHAAAEYVGGAAHNAAILMRLAEHARQSPDTATAEAAEKLIANAIQLRLYALQAVPRLYLGMVFPGARGSSIRIVERYEAITRQVVMLGLQYPAVGVSASL